MRRSASAPTTARWLARVLRPDLGRLVAAAVLGALALSCSIGLMATSAWLISRAAQHPPVLYLTVAIVAVRAFGIGRGVLRYAERLVAHDAAFRVLGRTRLAAWQQLDRAAPAGLGKTRSGDLLTRVLSDVDAIQDLLVRALLPIAVSLVTGLASVVLLGWLLPSAGIVLLAGLLIAGVGAPMVTVWLAEQSELRLSPARAALANPVHELLTGAADLTAYRSLGRQLGRIAEHDRHLTDLLHRSARGAGAGVALSQAALAATVVAELLVGVPAVRDGRLSGVTFAVLVLTPLAVFEIATPLPGAARHLLRGLRAADRLRALEDLPHPSVAWGNLPPTPGALVLEEVTAHWPGAAHPAIQGVDLRLSPGRRTALVGSSGSGKSTVASVLLGFLAPSAGRVTYDGVELSRLNEASFRRQVVLCAQGDHLFDTTIRNNLLIGRPDATDQDLLDVLARVRLADWVAGQPQGLDTTVGERAQRLSGGERQRLALARALLADPAVLILDEPTAHLDEPTAAELTHDILAATQGRTTLLITHRLDDLHAVDEVIELSAGQLVERGRPVAVLPGEVTATR